MSARKMNEPTENSTVNMTAMDTLWDKNANSLEDDSSMENSLRPCLVRKTRMEWN